MNESLNSFFSLVNWGKGGYNLLHRVFIISNKIIHLKHIRKEKYDENELLLLFTSQEHLLTPEKIEFLYL